MSNNILFVIILSFISLVVIRGYMSLGVRLCQSKKEWKKYTEQSTFIDRWFFWSASNVVTDKYSKSERRIVRHKNIVSAYRILNIFVHGLFAIELCCIGAFAFDVVNYQVLNISCIFYFVAVLAVFFVVAVIEAIANKKYHRSRYRW